MATLAPKGKLRKITLKKRSKVEFKKNKGRVSLGEGVGQEGVRRARVRMELRMARLLFSRVLAAAAGLRCPAHDLHGGRSADEKAADTRRH